MKTIPKQKYIPTHFHHLILTLVFLYLMNDLKIIYYTLGTEKKIWLVRPMPQATKEAYGQVCDIKKVLQLWDSRCLFGCERKGGCCDRHESTWWFQIFFIFTPIWGRFPI